MKTYALALIAASVALTPVALAENRFPFEFRYDADAILTHTGAQETHSRLEKDIEKACERIYGGGRGLSQKLAQQRCVEEAMEESLQKIAANQQKVMASRF